MEESSGEENAGPKTEKERGQDHLLTEISNRNVLPKRREVINSRSSTIKLFAVKFMMKVVNYGHLFSVWLPVCLSSIYLFLAWLPVCLSNIYLFSVLLHVCLFSIYLFSVWLPVWLSCNYLFSTWLPAPNLKAEHLADY